MKTRLRLILTLVVIFALIISGCDCWRGTKNVEIQRECEKKLCKELQAQPIKNELIFQFDKCANPKLVSVAIEKLRDSARVEQCMCEEEIIRATFDEEVDLEEAHASANESLKPNGLGNAYFNFEIEINPVSENVKFDTANNAKPILFDKEVRVAVIDGGINWDNELLRFAWENPKHVLSNDCNGSKYGLILADAEEKSNHGTLVSKFITNRIKGKLKLMDLRVFDNNNKGTLYDAICAIKFAIKNDANIINMSWGYYKNEFHPDFLEIIKETVNEDILLVASAGNKGLNTDYCHHYPSGFDDQSFNSTVDNVISVAYLNKSITKLAKCSNYGESSVSISAPGQFDSFEGSSYAAPQVTRIAAGLKSIHPDFTYNEIKKCILDQSIIFDPELLVETGGSLNEDMNFSCK